MADRRANSVHRVLNRPLTICGAERALFMSSITLSAAVWISLDSLLAGIVALVVLVSASRAITARDPQLIRILLNSQRLRRVNDPCKQKAATLTFIGGGEQC